jgi:hypothetical protein
MKKSIFAAAAVILLLTGCSNTNQSASPAPSPTAAASESISIIEDVSPQQVAYIDYFDARSPDGVAAVTYSKSEDIQSVLGWLSQLKMMGQTEPQSSAAPGTWSQYQIKLFSGGTVTVSFAENTVSFDEGSYNFNDPSGKNPGDTVYTMWMAPQYRSYPVNTDEIIVELFNQTGSEVAITFVPRLEKAEVNGWIEVACQSEFCGTEEPVAIPVMPMTIDMKTWYPGSTAGTYRLTMDASDSSGNPLTLSCVFELTEEA